MRFPSANELFWGSVGIMLTIAALRSSNEVVKAIYTLCLVVSFATAFLLKAIREK